MQAAIDNAGRLTHDARLLLAADRYASALSLALLAIEEAGKVSILRRMVGQVSESVIASAWHDYRSHTSKNFMALFADVVQRGGRKLDDFAGLLSDASLGDRSMLDQLKQVAFYTDCLGTAHWNKPTETISRELAESFVLIAETLSKEKTITELELSLWAKHVAPLSESKTVAHRQLTSWADAMVDAGLMSTEQREGFLSFAAPREGMIARDDQKLIN